MSLLYNLCHSLNPLLETISSMKNEKFYLVLNDSTDISWGNLPGNKKYFSVRIIATDLRGNRSEKTKKVYELTVV